MKRTSDSPSPPQLRPRVLSLTRTTIVALLCVCLTSQTGCKPLIQSAQRTASQVGANVANVVRRGFKKIPNPFRSATSPNIRVAAAQVATRLVITQLRQAYAEAHDANQKAKTAIANLPPSFPYRAMQLLKTLQQRNEETLNSLDSEIRVSQTTVTDSDAAYLKENFERITREQAAIARLAEKVG
jgi:hypothetical protein